MASPSACPGLSADAPPFVPLPPHLLPTLASVFVGYVPPLPGLLPPPLALQPCPFMSPLPPPISVGNPFSALPPPPVFPCPVRGPPPPPGFVANPFPGVPPPLGLPCPVQGMTPPPSFPGPFLGPPPPPGSPVTAPSACGFTQGPGVGQPPFMPMPHDMVARPAAPRANTPPAGTWHAASGKARPKPMAPRHLRAAAKRAVALGVVTVGDESHVAALASEPSPRSVLVAATPTPPGSPPVLPAAFPYPVPTPESPPAPAGHAVATERRRRRSGRPAGAQPDQPRRHAKQAPGRGGRRSCQRPRRWFSPESSLTTLMIRNIPNAFTREKMMNILDQHCAEENETIAQSGGVKSEYDFLYVPFDFKTQANKGYCFVNVTSPDAALRLWTHLHGFRWRVNDSGKTCEVDYADIQGREKLVSHFSQSWFDCHSEELLPVWFSPPRDGSRPAVVERHVVGQLGRRI